MPIEILPLIDTKGALPAALGDAVSKEELLAYMCGCPAVMAARMLLPDRLDPNGKRVPLTWYSDGVFAWTAETVAYVERYDMGLPEHFIAHVAAHHAAVPSFTDAERAALAEAFRAGDTDAAPAGSEAHQSSLIEHAAEPHPTETWAVNFEEHLRGFFCAVTRYYDGESDAEFRRVERQQASAHERVAGRPVASRVLMLAGFKAMLAGDGWKNVYWGDDESFPWEEEPEFLRQVLEIIAKELEASLPADALPAGLVVEVVRGGGVLNAPLE